MPNNVIKHCHFLSHINPSAFHIRWELLIEPTRIELTFSYFRKYHYHIFSRYFMFGRNRRIWRSIVSGWVSLLSGVGFCIAGSINPISGINISETAGARILNFMTFPKTKLGIFPGNFKLITVTGAFPEHRELGGPLRKVSLLGEHYDTDAL